MASTGLSPALVAIDRDGRASRDLGVTIAPAAMLLEGRNYLRTAIVNRIAELDLLLSPGFVGAQADGYVAADGNDGREVAKEHERMADAVRG